MTEPERRNYVVPFPAAWIVRLRDTQLIEMLRHEIPDGWTVFERPYIERSSTISGQVAPAVVVYPCERGVST